MARVGIVNYGMGNLRSVANAVEAVGGEPFILDRPEGLSETSHIILPGVGAFGDGMQNLRASGWVEALEKEVFKDPEVIELEQRFLFVRYDLTRPKPSQREILARYQIKGVPTVIFFSPNGIEEKSLRIRLWEIHKR